MDPEELLEYWFADALASAARLEARFPVWFGTDPAFDAALAKRFGSWAEAAAGGLLDGWRDAPRSALALVLLLDQLPRNLHRGRPAAFAQDGRARAVTRDALARAFANLLHPAEAGFLALPFMHAEDAAFQERSVAFQRALVAGAPPELRAALAPFARSAEEHRDVVRRFGRFPHRNAVLGRSSTKAERAFLAGGAPTFGQADPAAGPPSDPPPADG